MEKSEVISKLREMAEILESDNVRLEQVRIGSSKTHADVTLDGRVVKAGEKETENFDFDIDVTYLK